LSSYLLLVLFLVVAIHHFIVLAVVVAVVVVKRITLIKIYVNQHVEQVFVVRDGDCE